MLLFVLRFYLNTIFIWNRTVGRVSRFYRRKSSSVEKHYKMLKKLILMGLVIVCISKIMRILGNRNLLMGTLYLNTGILRSLCLPSNVQGTAWISHIAICSNYTLHLSRQKKPSSMTLHSLRTAQIPVRG